MTNKDVLVNHYQHLLEVCLKTVAADMSNYCPVNSSTQVAVQFPCQAYLSVYTISKPVKPRAGQQVFGDQLFKSAVTVSWTQNSKQMLLCQQNFICHAFLFENF